MSNNSNTIASLNGFFKETYADGVITAVPEGHKLYKMIKFISATKEPGNFYHQPVALGHENGFSYGGSAGNAFALEGAISAPHGDAQIKGSEMVLRSYLSMAAASRSQNSKAAFVNSTKYLVDNMLRSFHKRMEVQLMYGQDNIGVVSSATTTVITCKTYEWAPGVWVGSEGAAIEVRSSAGALRGYANVSKADLSARTVTVDAVPAGVIAGDYLFYRGAYGKEFIGLHAIMTNAGSMFNIDAASYSLWQANVVEVGTNFSGSEAVLSFAKIEEAVSKAMEKGLEDTNVIVVCNPRSWQNLLTEQAAKRMYDSSYSSDKIENGAKNIKFHSANGSIEIVPSIYCKEGYAYLLSPEEFMRVGSQEITFEQPGFGGQFFKLLEHANGYELRSYTDQALFTARPGYCVLLKFIKS